MFDNTYFPDATDRDDEPGFIRGVCGEKLTLHHYPSLTGRQHNVVVDVSEHDDMIAMHMELDQAKLLMDWLRAIIAMAEMAR